MIKCCAVETSSCSATSRIASHRKKRCGFNILLLVCTSTILIPAILFRENKIVEAGIHQSTHNKVDNHPLPQWPFPVPITLFLLFILHTYILFHEHTDVKL